MNILSIKYEKYNVCVELRDDVSNIQTVIELSLNCSSN